MLTLCAAFFSCTKEKTDYEAEIETVVTEHYEFKEAAAITAEQYTVHVEALNGTFYTGYNPIRISISTGQDMVRKAATSATFLPLCSAVNGDYSSGPHRYALADSADGTYFNGYAVFTKPSTAQDQWELYIGLQIDGRAYTLSTPVDVKVQDNKNLNMTSFTGKDGEEYIIALIAPQKPGVAENTLLAGIYRYNKPTAPAQGAFPDPSQYAYSEVQGYTLLLDPRMPEPSMGNHSSPNNKDLVQREDGLYQGLVNYTMTGNWTLNLIMLNQNGQALRGTVVPDDFTPGVMGVKSELYIDILF